MSGLTTYRLSEVHAAAIEERRGISCETAAAHGVVSNGNLVGFEYRNRSGELLGIKWRKPDKRMWTEWFVPESQRKLPAWNIQALEGSSPELLIITEGEFDALAWIESGASYVISVPSGAPNTPGKGDIKPQEDDACAWVWEGNELIPEIRGCKRIILSTDADRPGRILAEELSIRLGKRRCWLVDYPEGQKDANDVLKASGVDGLADLLANARSMWPEEMVSPADLPPNPFSESYSTGWRCLDPHLQLVPPELMIVTGLPGAGKSEWAWNLGCQMARTEGWKIGIIQFEDGMRRLMRTLEGYAQSWANDCGEPHAWIRRHFRVPIPDDQDDRLEMSERSMRWVLDRVEECAVRHGCRFVIIDPWNEIEHDWQRHQTEVQYISRMIKLLKQQMRRYSLAIALVAHPKIEAAKKQFDDFDLHDVSGGMVWSAKADHGVCIGRDEDHECVTRVRVTKCRDWDTMGRPGEARLVFDRARRIYMPHSWMRE